MFRLIFTIFAFSALISIAKFEHYYHSESSNDDSNDSESSNDDSNDSESSNDDSNNSDEAILNEVLKQFSEVISKYAVAGRTLPDPLFEKHINDDFNHLNEIKDFHLNVLLKKINIENELSTKWSLEAFNEFENSFYNLNSFKAFDNKEERKQKLEKIIALISSSKDRTTEFDMLILKNKIGEAIGFTKHSLLQICPATKNKADHPKDFYKTIETFFERLEKIFENELKNYNQVLDIKINRSKELMESLEEIYMKNDKLKELDGFNKLEQKFYRYFELEERRRKNEIHSMKKIFTQILNKILVKTKDIGKNLISKFDTESIE